MSVSQQWSDFLRERQAAADQLQPDAAALDGANILCDLSERGLLRVAGKDAREFLQGQLSNDVRKVDANHSQLTSFSNAKGRMIATARLFWHDQAYWLSLPQSMVAGLQRRLGMFVLRAEVHISDGGQELVGFGLAGGDANRLLQAAGLPLPAGIDGVASHDGITIVRVPCLTPRYEIHAPAPKAMPLWQTWSETARPVHPDTWALLDIRAGLPTVYPATSEQFVAQMANLELVDGVSFTKGCYTGQEVIARMHYLGKPKRRMYGVSLISERAPRPGDRLTASEDGKPAEVGTLVDARPLADGEYLGLAVIQKSHLGSELRLGDADGPLVKVRELPYPIETEAGTAEGNH